MLEMISFLNSCSNSPVKLFGSRVFHMETFLSIHSVSLVAKSQCRFFLIVNC